MRGSPLGRLAGAILSWALFAFCLGLLWLSASVVVGLGGFCASGGPYVIATECPATVAWATPVSIVGGLVAVGLGFLAGGFGTPLATWAWPFLFCSLGVAFLISGVQGSVTFVVLAVVFVVMGLVPLVLSFRAGWQRTLIGTARVTGERLGEHPSARPSLTSRVPANPDGAVPVRAGDAVGALAVAVIPAAVGVWLAWLVFAATSGPVAG